MTLLEVERDDAECDRSPQLWPPSARSVVAVVAGLFVLMYLVVALARLRYPYELEWIEGGMVNHVAQLRSGQPLYGPPSVTFLSTSRKTWPLPA